MLPRRWRRAWRTADWIRLLSGMTFDPLWVSHGVGWWILSLADSRVRISATPDSELGSKAIVRGSGRNLLESSARFDRDTHSWRTSQRSLFGGSTESSPIWPRSGSMRSGICFERRTSARPTSGSGSSFSRGLYPTPTASEYGSAQNGENGIGGENERPSAGTPSLGTWARTWATPTSRDWKDGANPGEEVPTNGMLGRQVLRDWSGRPDLPTLPDGNATSRGIRVLNPLFVEALMGLPRGWTVCGSSETGSSRSKPNTPSGSFPEEPSNN